jgi:hypothetical protein
MALADDIRELRDRVLADLHAAHDYYTDTQTAWRIARKVVAAGATFRVQSSVTGTVTTQANLAAKAEDYMAGPLAEATFQQFLRLSEAFFFDLLRLWLTAYPQSLAARKVDVKTVLDAPDKDAILLLVVDRELNEIQYERPAGWFAYLEDRARLGCPTADEVERIAEAKATRDVLVHSRGVAGKTYEAKAGRFARCRDGEQVAIPTQYHRETWELIRKIVTDLSNAAIAKVRWFFLCTQASRPHSEVCS